MTEAEILRQLQEPGALKPFEIKELSADAGRALGLDAVLQLSFDGVERRFGVEVRARSTAQALREAAYRAETRVIGDLLPMIASPYVAPEISRDLLDRGTSAVDLSGNVAVVAPGAWYVERLGAPNLYPETKLVKNPYRGTSSLVARLLVVGERFATAKDLITRLEELGGSISTPTVSKVLRQLCRDAMAVRETEVRATDRVGLLEMLAKNYQPPKARRRAKGRVEDLVAWRRTAAERAGQAGQRLVGYAPERWADFPSSYEENIVYTDSASLILLNTDFQESDRWPNLTVVETDEPTVYFDTRQQDGFRWCPPLEVYLQLAVGGKRERETAATIGRYLISSLPRTMF